MKTRLFAALGIGALAMSLLPARAQVSKSKELPDGAQFRVDGGTLRVQFWADNIVRVTFAASNEIPALRSLSVVASPAAVNLTRQEDDQVFALAAPRLKVQIDKR